ncbi:MAG: GNAT family N-acetyltransferase [Desulfobacterales bacterium]
MVLREALPVDTPAIARLYRILVPTDRQIEVAPDRIGEIAADPNNFLFVLDAGGAVVATAFVTLCLDPMYGFLPYAVLENLIVDPDRRRQGCGRRLMNAIEEICWRHRCTKMMLFSSVSRTAAHRFFSEMGFSCEKKAAFVKYRRHAYDPTCSPRPQP